MDYFSDMLDNLAAFFAGRGVPAWLVGGAARDLACGRVPADLDLAVEGDALGLARALADAWGGAFVPLDAERDTGRAVVQTPTGPLIIDIAALRAPTIEADLALRDFTINALAIPLFDPQGEAPSAFSLQPSALIDPTGGLADLQSGLLRPCGPLSLLDDPLRVLRAARMGAQFALRPAPELATLLRAAAPGLDGVAAERVRDELLKILDTPAAAPWLAYLDQAGALTRVFPELEPARSCSQPRVHFLPVLAHMLETVAALDWLIDGGRTGTDPMPFDRPAALKVQPDLPRDLPFAERFAELLDERRAGGRRRAALLKLAALLHDNAKPQTKHEYPDGSVSFYEHQEIGADVAAAICRRLRLARQDVAYVALVIREHMRPGQLRTSDVITARAVARFFRDMGDAGPDVLLHELADHLATRGPWIDPHGWAMHLAWVDQMLEAHWGTPPERREPLMRGGDLMEALGIGPGPQVGALLHEIAEAQAAGEITTREEALELARRMKEEGGR